VTTQEAYEKMRAWFSRPEAVLAREEWTDEEGFTHIERCFYREGHAAESEVRCAIGCLIPDELYDHGFEGTAAHALVHSSMFPELAEFFGTVSADFLSAAQAEHDDDRNETPDDFVRALDKLTEQYGLELVA